MKRYEIQVKHAAYGWCKAGTYPSRDKRECLKWLEKLREPFGAPKTYRLVELIPREIARVRSRKEKH